MEAMRKRRLHPFLAALGVPVALAAAAVGAVVTGSCAGRSGGGSAERPRLAPGDPLPAVEAPNQDGVTVRLAQLRGKPLVVYFYPKDRTPG
jgi:cytochrome oxidase Cu insertion factor (SCO1/SenC/PrrC family)